MLIGQIKVLLFGCCIFFSRLNWCSLYSCIKTLATKRIIAFITCKRYCPVVGTNTLSAIQIKDGVAHTTGASLDHNLLVKSLKNSIILKDVNMNEDINKKNHWQIIKDDTKRAMQENNICIGLNVAECEYFDKFRSRPRPHFHQCKNEPFCKGLKFRKRKDINMIKSIGLLQEGNTNQLFS
ncbi:hypothetical protein RFI_19322 [Reticulomyxa filosa]|uniref:Uncharacterized protein n=1 Tax=Reticulomyxa filosa TaxID=46433 RepID=X6MWH4_RETFI|nr:hypothetical protein RFI_19322 [Reticulomyxa filosa]|eukprot:ETO17981.1 hypothetical protein RFI_19322 [Reticulomyxa filosa]